MFIDQKVNPQPLVKKRFSDLQLGEIYFRYANGGTGWKKNGPGSSHSTEAENKGLHVGTSQKPQDFVFVLATASVSVA